MGKKVRIKVAHNAWFYKQNSFFEILKFTIFLELKQFAAAQFWFEVFFHFRKLETQEKRPSNCYHQKVKKVDYLENQNIDSRRSCQWFGMHRVWSLSKVDSIGNPDRRERWERTCKTITMFVSLSKCIEAAGPTECIFLLKVNLEISVGMVSVPVSVPGITIPGRVRVIP